MDIDSAIKVLKKHKSKVIADVYDDNDDIQEAILTVDEGFEYPEWSGVTIGAWLKRVLNSTHFKDLTKWPN